MKRSFLILYFLLFSVLSLSAQQDSKTSDTPRSYTEFRKNGYKIVDAIFPVHYSENKAFLEIPGTLFNREIEIFAQINKGFDCVSRDAKGIGVVKLIRGINNGVCFQKCTYNERVIDSKSDLSKSFEKSNIQSEGKEYNVVAYSQDGDGVIIDISENLLNGTDWYHVSGERIKRINTQSSKILDIHKIDDGLSFRIEQMYGYDAERENITGSMVFLPDGYMPLETGVVIRLLPEDKMNIRFASNMNDFQTLSFWDYTQNSYGAVKDSILLRWNFKHSTPAVTFYISESIPQEFIDPVKDGVSYWNTLFQRAGIDNSLAVVVSDNDDLLHERRAVIAFDMLGKSTSTTIVTHPLTGEILTCRINIAYESLKDMMLCYLIEHSADAEKIVRGESSYNIFYNLISSQIRRSVGIALGLSEKKIFNEDSYLMAVKYAYTEFPKSKSPYDDRAALCSMFGLGNGSNLSGRCVDGVINDVCDIITAAEDPLYNIGFLLDSIGQLACYKGNRELSFNRIASKAVKLYFEKLSDCVAVLKSPQSDDNMNHLLNLLSKYLLDRSFVCDDVDVNELYSSLRDDLFSELVSNCMIVLSGGGAISVSPYQKFFDNLRNTIFNSFEYDNFSNSMLDLQSSYVKGIAEALGKIGGDVGGKSNLGADYYFITEEAKRLYDGVEQLMKGSKGAVSSFYATLLNKLKLK